ncbi:hypothetical protein ACFWMG_11600 [Streptomyces sp. NPDC127074]|uniref:hypothetical protein n=1 Tax=Streptomyces sp. NPDC127074 TaxID=3347130 RepID=UPI00365D4953
MHQIRTRSLSAALLSALLPIGTHQGIDPGGDLLLSLQGRVLANQRGPLGAAH